MRINLRKFFTLSVSDIEYIDDTKDKIEYTGCDKHIEKVCLTYLPAINEYFRESERYYRVKEFDKSIDALEKAHNLAGEIKGKECLQCMLFFQATVTQTLEGIHEELESMSKGLFRTRKYQPQFEKADKLLKKFKKTKELKPEFVNEHNSKALQPAYV